MTRRKNRSSNNVVNKEAKTHDRLKPSCSKIYSIQMKKLQNLRKNMLKSILINGAGFCHDNADILEVFYLTESYCSLYGMYYHT